MIILLQGRCTPRYSFIFWFKKNSNISPLVLISLQRANTDIKIGKVVEKACIHVQTQSFVNTKPMCDHDVSMIQEHWGKKKCLSVKLNVSVQCSYIMKDEVGISRGFSSAFRCFYLEGVVAVDVGVGPVVGALPDDAAGQLVQGHNGDWKYRYYTEEDDDAEYPIRVGLWLGFGKPFLIRRTKIFNLINENQCTCGSKETKYQQ